MNIFVFNIKTIPDVDTARKIYELDNIDDSNVANIMFHKRRQQAGTEVLKLHLHKIVAISVVLRTAEQFRVWSLGNTKSDEKEIIERFFNGIDKYVPTIVSWNGKNFDLPILHYRALKHAVNCQRYWDQGDNDPSFKQNNYTSRYHQRHTDLMDLLAGYESSAYAPLDEITTMLGFPGEITMNTAKIGDNYQAGNLAAIRNDCEINVLNMYLVYLRFRLMTGHLLKQEYQQEIEFMRQILEKENKTHIDKFLVTWKG